MSAQLINENRILLKTAQLSCFFEPHTGFLRQVMVEDCEVVRAIYGAVRDQNWNTIQPEIVLRRIETGNQRFRLEFHAKCNAANVAFSWNGTIEGSGGTLSFKFVGEAKSTFRKNRIGLCLLHPIRECAGKRCRVRTVADSWAETEFPLFVAPHQPFKGLGAISWEPAAGLKATVAFTGEVFETEDQRNWTDASFKTYCTPLERPFPVEIETGTEVNQGITVELEAKGPRQPTSSAPKSALIVVNASEEKPLSLIGLGVSSYGRPLSEVERDRIAALHLDHLRIDVRFENPRWQELLETAAADAKALGARIQPALFLSTQDDLHAFAQTVDHQVLRDCLVFYQGERATPEPWLEQASRLLPGTTVIGGTNDNFAELNRGKSTPRFPAAFSINPQVHAFDDLSLMENLEAQPEAVQSTRNISAAKIFISPVTLRPRSNPNVTTLTAEPPDRLPSSVDPRQRTLFGAAWTVGSLARLLPLDGIQSLSYYETIGWQGLMEAELGNPLPDQFGSTPSEIFPLYHVFHALAEATALLSVNNPVPNAIAAIAFRKKGAIQVLLANLQPEPTIAKVRLPADRIAVQVLHEGNLTVAVQGRMPEPAISHFPRGEAELELPGYSFALLRCI